MPANGETARVACPAVIPAVASSSLLRAEAEGDSRAGPPDPKRQRILHGVLVVREGGR